MNKVFRLGIKENLKAIVFLMPWLAGTVVFILYPMISSFVFSFTNYSFGSNWRLIGINNFIRMFTSDRRFIKALLVTIHYVFMAVPVRLIASLFVALILNRGIKGITIYRAIFYIPSLLGGSVAIALLWQQVFGSRGLFNRFLDGLGFTSIAATSWITDPKSAIYTLIVLLVWQFGASMVIFLAGLKQIPDSLYEAGRIDGASKTVCFFRITLPMLSPIILFNLVMEMMHAFQAFTPAFVVSNGTGGVLDSLLFYTLYLYIKGFNQFQMGYASAMAWVLLVIIGLMTICILKTSQKWVHYE